MNKTQEALKLVLEEAANYIDALGGDSRKYRQALAAQQLSEPCRCGRQTNAWCMANTCSKAEPPAQQQEPVAWVWNPAKEAWEKVHVFGHWQQKAIYAFGPTMPSPLTEPQQKEPMQKIARLHDLIKDLELDVEFLSQPSKPWEGLTAEEADELVRRFARYELLRAIEAKLKEKNA